MKSKQLAELIETTLDDMKGESISCLNVKELTEITDYMIIVTGRSNTHVRALADEIVTRVKEAGVEVVGVEGKTQSEWVLVDLGDVVVHIMLASVRALYNLEDLWNFQSPNRSSEQGSGSTSR